jgi:hypothetical protein
MVDVRGVRNFYVLCCLLALAACSNGRGSLDEEQPPSGGAQQGFTVGGTITGLDGNGLVLQLNGGNDLGVSNDGSFTFTAELAGAAAYSVTVLTQPSGPSQTCTIGNPSGTIAAANVTNVAVTCATGAFALRGAVSGLVGTGLVLQNNGSDDLPIGANGEFGFPSPIASGAAYNVTVKTQPSGPSQGCTVANGTGTVGSADITNVAVSCATGTFTIGGTVTGLAGSGLVLQNSDGSDLAVSGNGPFQFAGMLASGATYNVTVKQHPTNPTQSCAVANGSGAVSGSSIANITVTCMTDRFTISGSISGLTGARLQLRLNNQPPLDVPAGATSFAFPSLVPSGTPYVVRVTRPPSSPAQDCTVANDSGVVVGANVTNVAVTCTTASFRIGGSVSGLQGSGLILRNNDGETLAIASNGDFFFSNPHASGSQYAVTVQTPPNNPSQACTVANSSGAIGSGDVRNVRVTCATNTFTVGGTVSGLLGTGLVLQNNGGNNLNVGADGTFTFTAEAASGATYNVTAAVQPSNPTQSCSVNSGSGTVGSAPVTSVVVNCSTSDFTVGGNIDGLAGSGLVLQNNGGDDLQVTSGGSFTFATAVPSGAPYNVTVAVQPTGPAQSCSVTNGSGVVGSGQVTSVQISCVTTEFSIGGTVAGLSGSGLVLQNNGADNLAIASDGTFKFPTSLPNGTPYNVTVGSQPSQQLCLVSNSVGVVSGADVETVQVNCVVNPL